MPSPEVDNRYQKAVLFPLVGPDSFGKPTVGPPCEVDVRWNTGRRVILDGKGGEIVLDATAVVLQRIAVGSRMWLGELWEWLGTGSSAVSQDQELCEVKVYNEVPDVKGRFSQKSVGLMRLHNKVQ